MGEEDFGSYDAGYLADVSANPVDTTSYIQAAIDSPVASVSAPLDAGQTTSWITDALGYVKTGVSYASGIAGQLGIKVAGIGTPTVAPINAAVQGGTVGPRPVQVGQGGTGVGMPWYLWGLIAAGILIVLYFLLYE